MCPLLLLLQLSISSQFRPESWPSMIWPGLDVTRRLVGLLTDRMCPSGGFSLDRINLVKPVQESDQSLDPSIFQ